MKVLNLRCAHGHGFEGWFGSDRDYAEQLERKLIECPLCGDAQIERMPTAARLSLSSSRVSSAAKARKKESDARDSELEPSAAEPQQGAVTVVTGSEPVSAESLWMRAVRHVMANTEDVGNRFADEARRIHYGEVPERGIRGQASPDETEALRDEGIEVHALPVPKALKGPAH